MAGKVATNPAFNVTTAAGTALFFLEKGEMNYLDLGALSDVQVERGAELLDYNQNRNGINALTRRFIQSTSLTFSASLDEPNIENLRIVMLSSGIPAISADPTYVRENATLIVQNDSGGEFIILPEVADVVDRVVESGDFRGPDATFALATDGIRVDISAGASEGDEVVCFYRVNIAPGSDPDLHNPRSIDISSGCLIEGSCQLRFRQQGGGIAQVYDIPSCEIAPNGPVDFSPEAVESFPITVTARELNGSFGTLTVYDVPGC